MDKPIKVTKCQFKLLREHSHKNERPKEIHSRIVQRKNKRKVYAINNIKQNTNIEASIPKDFPLLAKQITGRDKLGPDKLSTVSTMGSLNSIKQMNKLSERSKTALKARKLTLAKIEKIKKIIKSLSFEMKKKLENYKKIKKFVIKCSGHCKQRHKMKKEKFVKKYQKLKNIFPKLKKLRQYQKLLKFHQKKLEMDKNVKDGLPLKNIVKGMKKTAISNLDNVEINC